MVRERHCGCGLRNPRVCVAFAAGVLARQEEQIVLLFAPFRRFLLTAWAVGWGKQKNGSELFCSERH
nr:MAG TPA: hypothetical protein [Caudoviricetes sp.]